MSDSYKLFKFRRIDKNLAMSLTNGGIWCAKPETLNDPFDCQIDLRKSFANAAARSTGSRRELLLHIFNAANLIEDWTKKFKSAGVCAFSFSNQNSLMWSHYAENHKGVCLLYKFPESYFNDPANKIIGVSKVTYGNNILTEWLGATDLIADTDNFRSELTKVYLTSKSELWAYEDEVRILSFSEGLLKLPAGSLVQVCFGLQTPKADIDFVVGLASRFSGISDFYQMERGPNDFGLQAKQL